ncbi:hypothetical protein SAMN05428978_11443, partial [Nitrosomonas sp. Nm34]
MTYPISFRRKVLSVREKENLSIVQVAKRFDVGVASVMRWIKTPDPKTSRNKPAYQDQHGNVGAGHQELSGRVSVRARQT